jgi:glycosyltransferase involved in cell wall biosynthesis
VTAHGRIAIEAVGGARRGRHRPGPDPPLAVHRLQPVDQIQYAAMGKPVVASRLPMAERAFPPGALSFYEPGERDGLVAAIEGIVDDPASRTAGVAAALAVVAERSWEREAERYVGVIEGLIAARAR